MLLQYSALRIFASHSMVLLIKRINRVGASYTTYSTLDACGCVRDSQQRLKQALLALTSNVSVKTGPDQAGPVRPHIWLVLLYAELETHACLTCRLLFFRVYVLSIE